MAIRDKVYKVRLSSEEVEVLKSANVQNIARFMRESSLGVVNNRKQQQVYSKIDRDFLLELSRIGGNINQIAKALNTDIAKGEPFQAVKVLHLLIAINENLERLKDDKK
ncbi:TPA: plasmid mobilization relaxosome protein MobC [Salmonella enterica subsp. enterica serovar Paratyphi A]